MAFANVDIGSTPADGTGDPLRTAFSKINQNFANIAAGQITVTAPVRTVAGRTGNIVLTVNDVIGGASNAYVNSTVTTANTAMKSYVDAQVSGGGSYTNANVESYLPTSPTILGIQSNITTAQNNINSLVSNAAVQSSALDTLNSNAAAQSASLTTLLANAATQEASLTSLVGNAATQALAITSADANLGTATTNITTLFSNAAGQAGQILTINANIGSFQTYANTAFTSNADVAAYLPVYTGNIGANVITAISLSGTLISGFQDNITSVGTLDNLSVTGPTTLNGNLVLTNNEILASDVYISGNLNLNNNTTIISSEEINSTVRHLILVHNVTDDADALGAGILTPFSELTYNHVFNAWQSNVNLIPSASNTLDIGSNTGVTWRSGHFGNVYGNIATPFQGQITALGNLAGLEVSGTTTLYSEVIASNVRPRSNAVYSLGTVNHQWKDLYVSESTIYIGGSALTVSNGTLSLNGNSVGTYGNTEVSAYLPTYIGNMPYTMGNYQNWLGNVDTISSALDQIAERLKFLGH